MDFTTLNPITVAGSGAKALVSNLFTHYFRRRQAVEPTQRRDNLVWDQVFVATRNFFNQAALHTVENLQSIGNQGVPCPPGIRSVKVIVPRISRDEAARTLVDTLGPEEMKATFGGSEWWQETLDKDDAMAGEWLANKKDWSGLEDDRKDDEGLSAEEVRKATLVGKVAEALAEKRRLAALDAPEKDDDIETDTPPEPLTEDTSYSGELDEMRVTYFIHGGGAFFGSIASHRHVLWRLARKTNGRVFAINYRLAPQFPAPCGLQDVLAGYLYLISPPPESQHRPVDPSLITIGGDSAGGGLALALLCLIRDAGLPSPAGCVLISPWVDLTHSFPSILENTETDFIAPYGFMFKPSAIWPPVADYPSPLPSTSFSFFAKQHKVSKLAAHANRHGPQAAEAIDKRNGRGETVDAAKTMTIEVDGEDVEINTQIQLYATNEQLTHPFVSPIWQPSLGGLPPLYILAGDNEVLRDEIIYLAHRAANPSVYPLRQGLLDANPARAQAAASFAPTQVHLQVYDQVPHDLVLISFLRPAKYAFRAISSFIIRSTAKPPNAATDARGNGNDTDEPEFERLQRSRTSSGDSTRSSIGSNIRRVLTFSDAPAVPKIPKNLRHLSETIYSNVLPWSSPSYVDNMVRERVSWSGVVRPLEPASQISALAIDRENLGRINSSAAARYLAGKMIWNKRFAQTYKTLARKENHSLTKLRRSKHQTPAIDVETRRWPDSPPPSSLAARPDLPDGRKLRLRALRQRQINQS